MMGCTDRHDRYFLRLIAPNVLLYSEMITTQALIHGDIDRHLHFHPAEHPIALQLGGNEPKDLAYCARLAKSYGYDEVNLNVGCPSDRVKSGRFGACLMLEPGRVAECVSSMKQSVDIPVSVKCRIGVDDYDSYEALVDFIEKIQKAGCEIFIIHARKAWLNGLSPKQNREIPPLEYEKVYKLKRDFPHLTIVINGGIKTINDISEHLRWVDGVMIGREAYSNPYFLAAIEKYFFQHESFSREEIIDRLIPYFEEQLKKGVRLSNMTRHILGLFFGQKNARIWRRYLSENAHKPGANIEVLKKCNVIGYWQ